VSEAISSIFNPGVMKGIQATTGIGGLLSNILNSRKQGQVADQGIAHQKMVNALLANPALMSQKIAALRQPLSQGLVQSVTNDSQAQLAERGLGTSPQIAGAVEGQALAPFEQKSQEDAINAFLGTLGIGPSSTNAASGAIPGATDTSGFWNTFSPKPAPTGGGASSTATPGTIADPVYGDPGGVNA
jgi:hypothetical protein